MGLLLIAFVLAGVPYTLALPGEIAAETTAVVPRFDANRITFAGRFAPDGAVATIEIDAFSGFGAPPNDVRVLTNECRGKSETLDFDVMDAPLAILDLDGDGRDEVILLEGGNTVYNAVVARVEGCRLIALETSDDPPRTILSFFGHSNCCPDSGVGLSCRRNADGTVDILATDYESWSPPDYSNPDEPVRRTRAEVPWTRTVYALRGKKLIVKQKDTGTTKVRDDPSVPLLNRFDCLGKSFP